MSITMKKLGVLVLAAAIFCGISGYANARGPKGDGAPKYMEMLTPEQQEQARAIFEEGRNEGKSLREEMEAKRAELSDAMKSANPDTAHIETLSKELGQLNGKKLLARMATAEKLKKAGLPEMKKPEKGEKNFEGKKGGKEEFINKRIAKLPQEKQAEARKLFDQSRNANSQVREELKTRKAELDKALTAGDAAAVEAISANIGELKGKMLVAKAELRQNLVKAGIPADTFDREGKKDGKHGKGRKDGRHGKGDKHSRQAD